MTASPSDALPPGAWLPLVVELADPVPDVPTRGAAALRITALWQGQPLGTVVIPARVDPYPGQVLAEDLAHRFGWAVFDHRAKQVLLPPARAAARCTGTVVVCTRNRPESLGRCLDALAGLAPREGLDVLVVDNGDADDTTRQLVEGHGFRWVHEPLPGLNRARNRGLIETSSEIVLFADDDVDVLPGWADELLAAFADPLVAVATGLVLPAVLDSEHQRTVETHFGFNRGYRRRLLDGADFSPLKGGALGAGASMAFRREVLLEIGGFPEELDGGMPTKSGGDTYALYRVLRSGHRGVYQPRALSLHWHRDGRDELIRTVEGYSTGTYSFLLQALTADRDPMAVAAMAGWTTRWVLRRIVRAALRRDDAPPFSLAVADARGALRAPRALRAARRIVRERGVLALPPLSRPGPAASVGTPVLREPQPSLSVVVPTRGRRDRVSELLHQLDRQSPAAAEIVVVVDGDVDGTAAAVGGLALRTPVRVVVHAQNQGAAAARNSGAEAATGQVVLFLDDDVTPTGDTLLAAHLAAHAEQDAPVAVVGPCVPGLVHDERPLTLGVRNWWVDHVGRLTSGVRLTFTDLCTGNVSINRSLFEKTGGFRRLPRREDWEFGYRLQKMGVEILPAAAASVRHPTDHDLANMLRDRADEGAGDFLFADEHPEIAHLLPLWAWLSMSTRLRTALSGVFVAPDSGRLALRPVTTAVGGLNRLGVRKGFARTLNRANMLSYWTGVARAAGSEARFLEMLSRSPGWAPRTAVPAAPYELHRPSWDAPDPTTVELEVTVDGRHLITVPHRAGGFPWSAGALGQRLSGLSCDWVADQLAGNAL